MTLNEFLQSCLRTFKRSGYKDSDLEYDTTHAALGLVGETGEFVDDCIKKTYFYGRERDLHHEKIELGDILYYYVVICHLLGHDIEEIMAMNKQKLLERYPEGFKNA